MGVFHCGSDLDFISCKNNTEHWRHTQTHTQTHTHTDTHTHSAPLSQVNDFRDLKEIFRFETLPYIISLVLINKLICPMEKNM